MKIKDKLPCEITRKGEQGSPGSCDVQRLGRERSQKGLGRIQQESGKRGGHCGISVVKGGTWSGGRTASP